VSFEGLTKAFGKKVAVESASLSVPAGSVYGFLGPNGAGKTTTIRMLVGLIFPDQGSIELLGTSMPSNASTTLRKVGAMIEGPGFIPYLSGEDNLRRLLSAAGVRASEQRQLADRALDAVGLTVAKDVRSKSYSMGMKQRLSLAWAIALPRELYILDEPTNGLDPAGMREVRAMIEKLASEGSTVLLSSHLLAEIEQICSHVALMSQGKIIQSGSVEEFRKDGGVRYLVATNDAEQARSLLTHEFPQLEIAEGEHPGELVVGWRGDRESVNPAALNRTLVTGGVDVSTLAPQRRTLEDIFLDYVGEGFDVR
jgi:ABC-2 type transport system ATP-binding protein